MVDRRYILFPSMSFWSMELCAPHSNSWWMNAEWVSGWYLAWCLPFPPQQTRWKMVGSCLLEHEYIKTYMSMIPDLSSVLGAVFMPHNFQVTQIVKCLNFFLIGLSIKSSLEYEWFKGKIVFYNSVGVFFPLGKILSDRAYCGFW